jgi:hypothetical protein
MLLEVQEFRRRVVEDLPALVRDLQIETGRFGPEEAFAWEASLLKASDVLMSSRLQGFHIHVGQRGSIALEYRLPASSSYCDLVLLGRNELRPSAVIVELKDWHPGSVRRGPTETLVYFHGELALHPSDQVRGYVDYCRRFHSAVIDRIAEVHGCVFLTRSPDAHELRQPPHAELAAEMALFADRPEDLEDRFPDYVLARLSRPDADFAAAFEGGVYRQDRSFCRAVADLIESGQSPFALLDHQRLALAVCLKEIDEALSAGRKTTVIVEGPPGSGKSAVAAHLWAALRRRPDLARDACVVTTTSAAQRTNWKRLFERTKRGAAGVVFSAASYAPATAQWVGHYTQKTGKTLPPERWRQNVEICRKERSGRIGPETPPLISIVDEAHALINPESPRARTPSGYPVAFGPQAWHIIRASRVAVFLMDPEQGFRLRENTRVADLRRWSEEQGALVIGPVSLAGAQFRAAGSVEYTRWVDGLLDVGPRASWKPGPSTAMTFDVVQDPFALDEALRTRIREGHSARLTATFARPWVSGPGRGNERRARRSTGADFALEVERGTRRVTWTRHWNRVPGGTDYTLFIQPPPGSPLSADPLAEVGCPYVLRGFDFDYIGVLWLKDLVWRSGRWRVLLENVHETGIGAAIRGAVRELARGSEGSDYAEVLRRTQQAYRILLTRATKGVVVWFEDEETRAHVLQQLTAAW